MAVIVNATSEKIVLLQSEYFRGEFQIEMNFSAGCAYIRYHNAKFSLAKLVAKHAVGGKGAAKPAKGKKAGMDEVLPSLRRSHALLPSCAFHFTSTLLGLGSGRSVYCTSPIRRLRRLPSLVCSLV